MLRPADIPPLPLFDAWQNSTVTLPDGTQLRVAEGELTYPQPMPPEYRSSLSALPAVLAPDEVAATLALVNQTSLAFDVDPDSIDGMSSHELYLSSDEQNNRVNDLKGDADPAIVAARGPTRAALERIIGPAINERIIPFVRQRYPSECNRTAARACRVCSSVIRKYLPGSRRGVARLPRNAGRNWRGTRHRAGAGVHTGASPLLPWRGAAATAAAAGQHHTRNAQPKHVVLSSACGE